MKEPDWLLRSSSKICTKNPPHKHARTFERSQTYTSAHCQRSASTCKNAFTKAAAWPKRAVNDEPGWASALVPACNGAVKCRERSCLTGECTVQRAHSEGEREGGTVRVEGQHSLLRLQRCVQMCLNVTSEGTWMGRHFSWWRFYCFGLCAGCHKKVSSNVMVTIYSGQAVRG